MDFGRKCTIMRGIREMKVDVLAKKVMVDPTILAAITKNELLATPALEKRIRQALGWPPEIDELLEIVVRATYANGETGEFRKPLGFREAAAAIREAGIIDYQPEPEPTPVVKPTTIKPSQILKKKLGRPRKVRPVTENVDDDLLGDDDTQATELRGSVVG